MNGFDEIPVSIMKGFSRRARFASVQKLRQEQQWLHLALQLHHDSYAAQEPSPVAICERKLGERKLLAPTSTFPLGVYCLGMVVFLISVGHK